MQLEKDRKNLTKTIVSGNHFVIISARMVDPFSICDSNREIAFHTLPVNCEVQTVK